MNIDLNETQISTINTHINLLEKSRKKLDLQRTAYTELQSDFQQFLNKLIIDNNGDITKKYTLNPKTKKLEEIREE